MRSVALVHPGDLATRTGGYVYDRRAFAALAGRGWRVRLRRPARPVPVPGRGRPGRRRRGPGRASRRDGHGRRRPGPGRHAGGRRAPPGPPRASWPWSTTPCASRPASSRPMPPACARASVSALAACRRVIATSPATAGTLAADFGVPRERLTVAMPGTDPAPLAAAAGDPPRLLCVGTLTPRKGHRLLLEALASLRRPARWQARPRGERRPRPGHRRGRPRGGRRPRPRRPRHARRRARRRRPRRRLRRRRPAGVRLVPRGLRHGAGRGPGPRPADRRRRGRGRRRHRPARRRAPRPARRRGRARRGAAPRR